MTGRWAARRGDFRVIYRLDDDAKTMYVLKIARRGDVYRSR
ncbi:type II toxin-antitoxin system RelE family toxin [Jatrophihabitans sp.]